MILMEYYYNHRFTATIIFLKKERKKYYYGYYIQNIYMHVYRSTLVLLIGYGNLK